MFKEGRARGRNRYACVVAVARVSSIWYMASRVYTSRFEDVHVKEEIRVRYAYKFNESLNPDMI